MIVKEFNKKVKWEHLQNKKDQAITRCLIINLDDKNEEIEYLGEAKCMSTDTIDRRIGRKESLTKAIATFDRQDRLVYWKKFFNTLRSDLGYKALEKVNNAKILTPGEKQELNRIKAKKKAAKVAAKEIVDKTIQ